MVTRNSSRQSIEEFAAEAEQQPAPLPRSGTRRLPAWKRRNKEPKIKGYTLRASESQMELLRLASEEQEISVQKVLERIVWPVLEDQYGEGASR